MNSDDARCEPKLHQGKIIAQHERPYSCWKHSNSNPKLATTTKAITLQKYNMDTPPECSGHSHDHEHSGDDLGLSLRPQIDLDSVKCLNEDAPNMGRAVLKLHEERLSAEPFLRSQEDDPELLLYIQQYNDDLSDALVMHTLRGTERDLVRRDTAECRDHQT